jgi:hypothetical protein
MFSHEKHTLQFLLKQAQALVAHALGIAKNGGAATELTRQIKDIGKRLSDARTAAAKLPTDG